MFKEIMQATTLAAVIGLNQYVAQEHNSDYASKAGTEYAKDSGDTNSIAEIIIGHSTDDKKYQTLADLTGGRKPTGDDKLIIWG